MKKILLSALTMFTLALYTSAQNGIEIAIDSQPAVDLSGSTYSLQVTDNSLIALNFLVSNNTGSPANWRITRLRIDVPGTWVDYLCWGHSTDPFGGTCYGASQMATNPWTTPANDVFGILDGEKGKLTLDIEPDQNAGGFAHYRYYITNDGVNFLDSIDIEVTSILGIKEVKQEVSLNIAPNPASDLITINLSGVENGSVKIVDVLGNVVFKDATFINTKKIDVSNFKNGVYFVMIESNGIKTMTRKIIVKH